MKKKILFIIPYLLGGGALKTVSNLSKKFSEKYDISIIGIYKSDKKFKFTGNLIELNMLHQKNLFLKFKDFLYIRKFVKEYKENNNFDFSISFLIIADFINVLSKSKNKEKTIISIRNIESIEYKNKWFRRLQISISTKLADFIVSISKEVEKDLIYNFKVNSNKILTIYNPCVLDDCSDEIDETIFAKGKTAITLGGLKYQKGYWHLIRSFSKVVKELPESKLLIFGCGDYHDYLNSLIKSYNLGKNVLLMGYVIGPYDYVRKSDLFVFSSLYEGLGNALMEALKCGVPILSSDYSSGAREILAPNTDFNKKVTDKIDFAKYGILVPVCDGIKYNSNDILTKEENLMADAIIRIFSDENVRKHYSKMSIERSKSFDINTIANEWYDLFDKMR